MCHIDVKKTQVFQGVCPYEPSPGRRHELVAELTASCDPHVHYFRTFENSIFIQKRALKKLVANIKLVRVSLVNCNFSVIKSVLSQLFM